MLGQSLLLVRDADGTLRGYFNSCRHRGHELLPKGGCAHRKTIACPYHNWTYNLDGSLRGARDARRRRIRGVRVPTCRLPRPRVARVRLRQPRRPRRLVREPAREPLGRAGAVGARALPPRDRSRLRRADELEARLRELHGVLPLPSIHPALCRVSKVGSEGGWNQVGLWAGGPMELEDHAATMSLDGTSGGVRFRGLDERQAREVIYLSILRTCSSRCTPTTS